MRFSSAFVLVTVTIDLAPFLPAFDFYESDADADDDDGNDTGVEIMLI